MKYYYIINDKVIRVYEVTKGQFSQRLKLDNSSKEKIPEKIIIDFLRKINPRLEKIHLVKID